MSQKSAKRLRKRLYGEGKDSKESKRTRSYTETPDGKIVADPQRRIYQRMKRALRGI